MKSISVSNLRKFRFNFFQMRKYLTTRTQFRKFELFSRYLTIEHEKMKIRRNKENKLTQITGHFDGYHKTMVEYDIKAIKVF